MSFVTRLLVEGQWTADPTWEQVEVAIASLDGEMVTELHISPDPPLGPPEGEHHMGMGGGRDGRCVVYLTEDNLHFGNLEDATKKHLTTRFYMVAGGQEGDFREDQCVPKAWAVAAAREYFETGRSAVDLPWVES